MSRNDYVRDYVHRGLAIEERVCGFLRQSGFTCTRNIDPYDIDLELVFRGKKILIEVEESSRRFWPSTEKRPIIPSRLMTMPIRKIRYLIEGADALETHLKTRGNINTIQEFESIFKNVTFVPKRKPVRIWLKVSYDFGEHMCIATSDLIADALNCKLRDQDMVNSRIEELKFQAEKHGKQWFFKGNLWENHEVKNMIGLPRTDTLLLILGYIGDDNLCSGLIFCRKSELITILENISSLS